MGLVRCTSGFSYSPSAGVVWTVGSGELLDESDPAVVARRALFAPTAAEQLTAFAELAADVPTGLAADAVFGTTLAATGATMTAVAATSAFTGTYANKGLLPVRGVGGRFAVVTILCYHTVPNGSAFAIDLDFYLEWNYTPVTLDQIADHLDGTGTLPEKPLLITFDDGYASMYSDGFPELQLRGMKATIYLVTDFIDGTISLNYGGETTPLSWPDINTMFTSGLIDMQSHTKSHPDLRAGTPADAVAEYQASQARINAQVTGANVRHIAYPFGSWSDAVADALYLAGCRTGRAVRVDPITGEWPGANLGRYLFATTAHDRMALPSAGTGYGNIAAANYNHRIAASEELVPDYGFAGGGMGWTTTTGSSLDTTDPHTGTQCLRLTQQSSTISINASKLIPVGMYPNLRGSVWIKTVGLPAGTLTKVQILMYRADQSTLYAITDAVTVTGNNGAWTEYAISHIGDQNAAYFRPALWLQTGGGSPSGYALFDDLTVRTDTLPPPLATVAAVP